MAMKLTHLALIIFSISLVACAQATPEPTPVPPTATVVPPTTVPTQEPAPTEVIAETSPTAEPTAEDTQSFMPYTAYTHLTASGNRYLEGTADLPNTTPIDIALSTRADWVLGVPYGDEQVWVALLEDNTIESYQLHTDGTYSTFDALTVTWQPGQAPILEISENTIELRTQPQFENAIPHGRVTQASNGAIIYLSNPTDIYGHGVLGDVIEAACITVVPVDGVSNDICIDPPAVIEGVAPILADMNNDGRDDILVTLADSNGGAKLVLFDQSGEWLAASAPIGQGNRWRNQLAIVPTGPDGQLEAVDVLTPHLNATVEYFQLNDNTLERVAAQAGYTSHYLGSPNLDLGIAADFDGDGNVEILLTDKPTGTLLGAIRRGDGAENAIVAWELALDGGLLTNIAAFSDVNGHISVGVGTSEKVLRIWP